VFRVGVTADFRSEDGSFLFAPAADLRALDERPGVEWEYLPGREPVLSAQAVSGFDALLHLLAGVTAETLAGAERLVLIARSGVGLDPIDLDACTAAGIAVTITPDAVPRPMASAAVALILALAHRLADRNDAFRRGAWDEGRSGVIGTGLPGRTLGLIGFGRIGREVNRLLRPFELRTLVATPRLDDRTAREHGVEAVDLDTLLSQADFVLVACPLNRQTIHLLDERRLALMRPSAFLVNVARGGIVDERALVAALEEGRIAGAGLDVFEEEPLGSDAAILRAPNVIAAPHSLGYTDDLLRGCVGGACAAILAVAAGEVPVHVVNPDVLESRRFRERLRALSQPEGRR
jgi:phosphoglycerate dehydrogenase-like enzyme